MYGLSERPCDTAHAQAHQQDGSSLQHVQSRAPTFDSTKMDAASALIALAEASVKECTAPEISNPARPAVADPLSHLQSSQEHNKADQDTIVVDVPNVKEKSGRKAYIRRSTRLR